MLELIRQAGIAKISADALLHLLRKQDHGAPVDQLRVELWRKRLLDASAWIANHRTAKSRRKAS